MTENLDLENWSCPLPLRDYPAIVMGHGGGGRLSAELVEHQVVRGNFARDVDAVILRTANELDAPSC